MKKNYIPTINISALLSGNFKNKKEMKILKEIEKASINVGFFQIVGHGISKKSIKDIKTKQVVDKHRKKWKTD